MRTVFVILLFVASFEFLLGQSDSLFVDAVDFETIDTIKVDSVKSSEVLDTFVLFPEEWLSLPQDTVTDSIIHRKDSGMLLLTAKIGFSDSFDDKDWEGYSINHFAPMALQVEYFHNDLWSYGGQLVYSRNKFTNDTLSTTYDKNSTFGLAALGTFHYGTWLQDVTNDKFRPGYLDLYVSLAGRMDIHRDVEALAGDESKSFDVQWRLRPIFGARYYISDRFSMNIEIGRGNLGMLTSSVSWLLNKPEGLKIR